MYVHWIIWLCMAGAGIAAAVLYSEDVQQTSTDQPLGTGVEVIVQQGFQTTTPTTTVKNAIMGAVVFTRGNNVFPVILRIRRGTTITSTQVGITTLQPSQDGFPGAFTGLVFATDVVSNVTGAQYCLTVQTANDSYVVNACQLDTKVLSG